MRKKIFLCFILVVITISFWNCGMLGGFENIKFPVVKPKLEAAIDSLYARNPDYIIPDKWKKYDDWNARGFGFLDTRIFYFISAPEEMYYVSFVGDESDFKYSKDTKIAIRAVFNLKSDWALEENISSAEKARIRKRFSDQIVVKLEEYTNTKSF